MLPWYHAVFASSIAWLFASFFIISKRPYCLYLSDSVCLLFLNLCLSLLAMFRLKFSRVDHDRTETSKHRLRSNSLWLFNYFLNRVYGFIFYRQVALSCIIRCKTVWLFVCLFVWVGPPHHIWFLRRTTKLNISRYTPLPKTHMY